MLKSLIGLAVLISSVNAFAGNTRYLQCSTMMAISIQNGAISGLQGRFVMPAATFARIDSGAVITQLNQDLKDMNGKSIARVTVQAYMLNKKSAHVSISLYNAETATALGTANGVSMIDGKSDGLNEMLISTPIRPNVDAVFNGADFGLDSVSVEAKVMAIATECKLL